MDSHHSELHEKLEGFIQNHLPIHLLRLEDMALVTRSELHNQISHEIDQKHSKCEEDTLKCFNELKKDIQFTILSHRWSLDELSFHDLSETTRPPGGASSIELRRILGNAKSPWRWEILGQEKTLLERLQEACSKMPVDSGYTKLVKLCEIAIKEDCKFAWLDTVCINKESSAELEESIRSMFGWYRDSHVCVVHLAQTHHYTDMGRDQWFQRGWTLQELLAPRRALFYSSHWVRLTSRLNDKDVGDVEPETPPLIKNISSITDIPVEDLIHFKPGLINIRQRMSWAWNRKTTRVEDMAYCLIGIFGVSLSVAYGEREHAFHRLQMEIMQSSDDRGLFHWEGEPSARNSMFAIGPQCFRPIAQHTEILRHVTAPIRDPTYALTNFGLRIWLEVYQATDTEIQGALNPLKNLNLDGKKIAILAQTTKTGTYLALVLSSDPLTGWQYRRVELIELAFPPSNISRRDPVEIFIT